MRRLLLVAVVAAFYGLTFSVCTTLGQGSLTPPGEPAPTMKSLDQLEPRTPISSVPYTITQSGSYYLTTNLTANPAEYGIAVLADDVTIDLNGFTLTGSGIDSDHGIYQGSAALRNLRVFGGKVDLYIDVGVLDNRVSTVVDVSGDNPVILREGAIPESEIRAILKSQLI